MAAAFLVYAVASPCFTKRRSTGNEVTFTFHMTLQDTRIQLLRDGICRLDKMGLVSSDQNT